MKLDLSDWRNITSGQTTNVRGKNQELDDGFHFTAWWEAGQPVGQGEGHSRDVSLVDVVTGKTLIPQDLNLERLITYRPVVEEEDEGIRDTIEVQEVDWQKSISRNYSFSVFPRTPEKQDNPWLIDTHVNINQGITESVLAHILSTSYKLFTHVRHTERALLYFYGYKDHWMAWEYGRELL